MELRKRKNNNSYNDASKLNETENLESPEQSIAVKSTKNNNNKRKRKSDSDYEYTSDTESKSIVSTDSGASSQKSKKKRNKKKLEIYKVDSDDTDDDILNNSSYDPIIQQNVTIATPLRTMKKVKFNNTLNEVIDLVGDSDEEMEVITILDSDDDKEILVENEKLPKSISNKVKKQNSSNQYNTNNKDNNNSTILIDLSGDEGETSVTSSKKSSISSNKRNLRRSSRINNKLKSESEKSDSEKSGYFYNTRNKGKKNLNDEDEIKSDKYNNKSKRQKRAIISDDSYSSSNSTSDNTINKNNKDNTNNEEPKHEHNLRNHSKLKSDSSNNNNIREDYSKIDESSAQRKNEFDKSEKNLKSNDIKKASINSSSSNKSSSDNESRNDSYNGDSSIIHDLESMNIDDLPSGNIDSIEISSDDSDDDVLEIVSHKKERRGSNEIEISDDDNSRSNKKRKTLRNSLPESSMKKSIELRSSRIKKKNENRSLALKRLKERKVNAYNTENLYNNENSEEENISPMRSFFPDNDDFVVSDSGSEEIYFLTTKWDIKQRKKLYKAFKRLYKFCIAILVHEEYIKTNINELKKAFQIINKRINNVCKKITPVPPWTNKFQADIDSYPRFSVNSEYPKSVCDSCREYITSSFAVSFSGRKYNKLSLKETKDKPLKDKERVYIIDRVCLERVQIYHELYHFRYNTLKEVKSKMSENNINIDEYRKSKDENKVEDIFSKLKVNCKELYVKLSEKLKNGEKYVPNTLDV